MENTISVSGKFFNAIHAVPCVSLGTFPTPLKKIYLENGCYFWVKDDGLSSLLYGGNKVRKLEYLLAEARQNHAARIIVCGDYSSHNVRACALFGRKLGFDLDIIVFPSPNGHDYKRSVAMYEELNANVVKTKNIVMASLCALKLKRKGGYVVPLGGSSPVSAVGYVKAGLELGAQLHKDNVLPPKKIYVALGTAGTIAGLLIGLSLAEMPTQVVAVRTIEPIIANKFRLSKLVLGALEILRLPKSFYKAAMSRLEYIDRNWLGRGYGHTTHESQQAVELMVKSDLALEPVFTGKTMAAMLNRLPEYPRGELLFWNTHSRIGESNI